MTQGGSSRFLGFCVFLLGAALLTAGAWLSSYRPPVEYARATEKETGSEPGPRILLATGLAVVSLGAVLLLRKREK